MDDSKNNNFPNMQWKQFEQFFGSKFPFPAQGSLDDVSWVEQYVQNALKQTMSKSFAGIRQHSSSPVNPETFETVTHVIVKIDLPKEKAKNMRIYSGVGQVRLEEGVGVQKHSIPLPSPVIPESGKAIYKNGILQLQLRKQQIDDPFHEVKIRFF